MPSRVYGVYSTMPDACLEIMRNLFAEIALPWFQTIIEYPNITLRRINLTAYLSLRIYFTITFGKLVWCSRDVRIWTGFTQTRT